MSLTRVSMLLLGCAWLAGCSSEPSQSSFLEPDDASVPYCTAAELKAALAKEDGLVLVEFCVPVGCFRCDEMRPHIDRLAHVEQDRTVVHRVDLTLERAFASQLGVTMCPSYVAFRNGEEVFRTEYPTSSDLIALQINHASHFAEVQQLSNQSVH